MDPFKVDYCDLESVIAFAKRMVRPQFPQFVVKYPTRDNYNITMQVDRAKSEGATVVWSSTELN